MNKAIPFSTNVMTETIIAVPLKYGKKIVYSLRVIAMYKLSSFLR